MIINIFSSRDSYDGAIKEDPLTIVSKAWITMSKVIVSFIVTIIVFLIMIIKASAASDTNHLNIIEALDYSADGHLIAAGDSLGQIAIWRLEDGDALLAFTLRALESPILALRFTPDDSCLEFMTYDSLHVVNIQSQTDKSVRIPSTTTAVFSADSHLVTFPNGEDVIVLDTGSDKIVRKIHTALGFPETIAFSQDNRFLAVGAQQTMQTILVSPPRGVPSGNLEVYDLVTGSRRIYKALTPWFSSIAFSGDSKRIAAVTFDHKEDGPFNVNDNTIINVWDLNSGNSLLQVQLAGDTALYSYLSFLGTSNLIVSTASGWEGGIAIIDTNNGKVIHGKIQAITASSLNQAKRLLAVGGFFEGIELHDIPSLRLISMFDQTGVKNNVSK